MAEKNDMRNMNIWDVTVILTEDGVIVNGTNGVMKGMSSELGIGKLGYMKLSDK